MLYIIRHAIQKREGYAARTGHACCGKIYYSVKRGQISTEESYLDSLIIRENINLHYWKLLRIDLSAHINSFSSQFA